MPSAKLGDHLLRKIDPRASHLYLPPCLIYLYTRPRSGCKLILCQGAEAGGPARDGRKRILGFSEMNHVPVLPPDRGVHRFLRRVGVAVAAEMGTGVVRADVLADDAAALFPLAFVFESIPHVIRPQKTHQLFVVTEDARQQLVVNALVPAYSKVRQVDRFRAGRDGESPRPCRNDQLLGEFAHLAPVSAPDSPFPIAAAGCEPSRTARYPRRR